MSAEGLPKIRALYEGALSAGGLHLKEGHLLWTAYRELEQAVLEVTDAADTDVRALMSGHKLQSECSHRCLAVFNPLLLSN